MKFILGQKKEMTQVYEDGKVVPVTRIQAGPCYISAIKNLEKEGYKAVQVVFLPKKKGKKSNLLKGVGSANFYQFRKEFRVMGNDNILDNIKVGQEIKAAIFEKGDKVRMTGVSRGKGFQGVVKRHGFSGSPATHGHKDQLRMPGSIGAGGPAHVFKGTRMGGHMGDDQVSLAGVQIVVVDADKNELFVKGSVPGARNGLVILSNEQEFKIVEEKKVEEQPIEAPADEGVAPANESVGNDAVANEPAAEQPTQTKSNEEK
ncbi:MAG TPA: 50S ribosomal protein L3 [Candidatus Bipolaricaulota bacterium]|nr:50S ribosomal protein L3 [Candidatus Bipolaricaulota bacterium]